ncbi:MAG: hypothetical protein OIF32_06060 [Campylobacterales bacterium]|nr:hypothetical protein [Campylobacterales bacterium]
MEVDIVKICKDILLAKDINPASTIEYDVNGQRHTVTVEWIIQAYAQGNERTQALFVSSLQTIADTNRENVKKYFEDMGQLIILTSMSENDTNITGV